MVDGARRAGTGETPSRTIRIVVATGNAHKVHEMAAGLKVPGVELVPVSEVDPNWPAPDETEFTFEGNATIKALDVAERYRCAALADDSGLVVDALMGAPGVLSARFAGPEASDADNNTKLLGALGETPVEDRTARFVSVLVLAGLDTVLEGAPAFMVASGTCEGTIGTAPVGDNGFGYDPLFLPADAPGRSMAELTLDEKNGISHRGNALAALSDQLTDVLADVPR